VLGYPAPVHIILIAWLYVAVLIAATEPSLVGSLMSLAFYGLLPAAIIAYIGTTRQRRERRRRAETPPCTLDQLAGEDDGTEPERDERDLSRRGADVAPLVQARDEVCHGDVDHARGGDGQKVGQSVGELRQ